MKNIMSFFASISNQNRIQNSKENHKPALFDRLIEKTPQDSVWVSIDQDLHLKGTRSKSKFKKAEFSSCKAMQSLDISET